MFLKNFRYFKTIFISFSIVTQLSLNLSPHAKLKIEQATKMLHAESLATSAAKVKTVFKNCHNLLHFRMLKKRQNKRISDFYCQLEN